MVRKVRKMLVDGSSSAYTLSTRRKRAQSCVRLDTGG